MTTRQQAIDDARTMLDWLEAHSDVPLPYQMGYGQFNIFNLDSKGEAERIAKIFGTCEKIWSDELLSLRKTFGSVKLDANFYRNQICERVVVSTEEIPETVIPERVEPAYVKETIEWRCGDSILSPKQGITLAPAVEEKVEAVA